MQRQSLGSPSSSKVAKDEQLCCEPREEEAAAPEEEGLKKLKPRNGVMPETYIHLIPMLTLLCFLILYLSSHDPSLNDSAQLNVFFNPEEGNISDIKKGDILAIRSLKNLEQEPDAAKHRRFHRKFVHF